MFDNAKVRHPGRPLAGYGGLGIQKTQISRIFEGYFGDSYPMPLKEGGHLEFPDQVLVDRTHLHHFLVLKILGQVNAVIFTDILHGLRRKQTGIRQDTHGIEDVTTGPDIPAEGTV